MKQKTNIIYQHAFWVVSCLGVLLSTTSLAQAHTRWLVVDSLQAEGDADVTEVADNVIDPQPVETNQLEDEFWSEALQNVEVSSALETDEDIPTLTAEGSFILPTYILPEADARANVAKPAVVDGSNPWRQDGVVVGEATVVETPTLENVEQQYAQTENLLAQTSTQLETIEARIRDLQAMNAQMAQATQDAVDAETERLAEALPKAQPAEPVAEEVVEEVVAQPAQPQEVAKVASAEVAAAEGEVEAQKEQIEDTKEKIAKLQQTVEYAGLQVAYQDTTALLNNTAKKLKNLENDLTQLKQTEADTQKAKLVEDQRQKTAELLTVTTAQLESVEKRMAALDAQENELKEKLEAEKTKEAAVEATAETTPAFDPYGRRARAVEQQKEILAQERAATAQKTLPTMQVADATAAQIQNAAEALANATARLEALEARLNATSPRETNLAVAAPCPPKRPWLLPVEAIEEEASDTPEDNTIAANIPTVKDTYVDRVLQAIDRFEKNRTAATYADDVMLRTIPNEIKINFQPGRADLSAQALKWIRVFSAAMKHKAQNAIEIRLGMQQLELQARRFALLKAALLNNGVSPRQIRFTLTNRDNDSVILRVIPLVQDVDLQQVDTQTGQKIKQVVYQW
ncbi:MAG: hypothetical protein ILP11_02590 [Alphaproteobacteria bacterium]|nr:hypothetical protein [Alphaproteobacteria bacterium]